MKLISGVFNFDTNEYTDNSSEVYRFTDSGCSVCIFGRAETDGEINNGKKLIELYRSKQTEITKYINGTYIAIFWDENAKVLRAFHDRATSPVALYYTQQNSKVFISTSLRALLKESGINRKLNDSVLEDFLTNGFLYGRNTLIESVYKVEAFHCLEVSVNGVSQIPVEYPLADMSAGEALDSFKEAVDKAVLSQMKDVDEVSLPLSSGFDSNYICHIVTENSGKEITAFSVGGKSGKNELPIVEKNISYYKKLKLKTALTSDNSLQYLPDIVWRLEGNVYETGLFLQYELAKLVSSSGKKTLICGECADQVMNLYYLQKDRISVNSDPHNPVYYEFSEYPYIFGSYLILKKNGILMNSFGVETRYPYLDSDVVSVSHALRNISRKDKRVHVANCNECLPPEVIANMSKIGGATDCHSLFESTADANAFIKKIEDNAFYKKYRDVIEKHAVAEEKQTGITLLKTKIRNLILQILHLKKGPDYYLEEVKLRYYVGIAYLIVFNELFIEGNYDMSKTEIDKTIENIL